MCDELGAVVKNSWHREMLTGKVIADSKDLFKHCQDNLSHGLRLNDKDNTGTVRQFIYIGKEDVDRTNTP